MTTTFAYVLLSELEAKIVQHIAASTKNQRIGNVALCMVRNFNREFYFERNQFIAPYDEDEFVGECLENEVCDWTEEQHKSGFADSEAQLGLILIKKLEPQFFSEDVEWAWYE